MAQRVIEFRKKPTAAAAASEPDDAPLRGIPLDLAPLLAPFKRKGRLTLRIERMADNARLTAGRNNGDKTWSLNLDELEDLEYLPPEHSTKAHTLALRVIAYDGDGATTLGVVDVPITPNGGGTVHAAAPPQTPEVAARDVAYIRQLRDDLAKLSSQLADRESQLADRQSELGEALKRAERAEAETRNTRAEIGSQLTQRRNDREAEHDARISELEASVETRLKQANESSAREMRDALAKAELSWKAREAERLAAAEKQWQAQANKTLADAAKGGDSQRNESKAELRRLSDDLARARTEIAERDAKLARLKPDVEATKERAEREAHAAMVNAEAAWKRDEAVRMAAAESKWREQAKATATELTERCERAEAALADAHRHLKAVAKSNENEAELRELKNRLAATEASVAAREHDLAKAQGEIAVQRQREQELSEACRLLKSAAQSDRRDHDLSELRNKLAAAEENLAARGRDLVKVESAVAVGKKREEELSEAYAALEAAHRGEQDRVEVAVSKAVTILRREEAERVAAAERRLQEAHGRQLAEAKARCEAVEAALAEKRGLARELSGGDSEKLRAELATLQAILDSRETELAELRRSLNHGHVGIFDSLRDDGSPESGSAPEKKGARRSLVRDIAVVMIFVAGLVILYPHIESYLPESWQIDQPADTGDTARVPPKKPAPAPEAQAQHDIATVVRGANLRAGASTQSDVIATLARGAEVEMLEQRGSWALVRTRADPSNSKQGWVFSSYVKVGNPAGAQKH